jgi:hypothetical protein
MLLSSRTAADPMFVSALGDRLDENITRAVLENQEINGSFPGHRK